MRLSPARRAAGVAAAIALVSLAWTGAVLTWRYRPDPGGSTQDLSAAVEWSRWLVQWHDVSLCCSLLALALWCGLTVAGGATQSRRAAVVISLTVAALTMVALSAAAWNRVRWNQLGLWAVTVGQDIGGLWYAAFSDDVRFAFVGKSGEVPPSDLAPWVVVYLVAPFLALLLFAVAWLVARPARSPRRSIVSVNP